MPKQPRAAALASTLLWCLGTATAGYAHTLFIKPESFYLSPAQPALIPLFNGTFELSESKVVTRRMTGVSIVTPSGERRAPQDTDWQHDGDTTILSTRFDKPGNYVIGVGTKPAKAHISADNFNAYLSYEGLADDAEERERLNETSLDAAERYAKFAKALIQVGSGQTANYDAVLGYPVEIVPLVNPYSLGEGSKFRAQILKDGNPLANELVFATHEGFYELNAQERYEELITTRSDENGVVELELAARGRWYIRFIHLVRQGDSEYWYSKLLVWLGVEAQRIPYESQWATLTFEVR
jgi:hypothetical protein